MPGFWEQMVRHSIPKRLNRFLENNLFWDILVSRLGLLSEYDYWLVEFSPTIPQKSITTNNNANFFRKSLTLRKMILLYIPTILSPFPIIGRLIICELAFPYHVIYTNSRTLWPTFKGCTHAFSTSFTFSEGICFFQAIAVAEEFLMVPKAFFTWIQDFQ